MKNKIIGFFICSFFILSITFFASDGQQIKQGFFNDERVIIQWIDEKDCKLISMDGDHLPIRINGNDNFIFENGVTGGNGSENNPYVIENWVFIMDGSRIAINIGNTDMYFKIRNCTIKGFEYGISLWNVANGIIEKTIMDCITPIRIEYYSSNIKILDNIINSSFVALCIVTEPVLNINISRNTFNGGLINTGERKCIFSYNSVNNSMLCIFGSCDIFCNNFITKPEYPGLFCDIFTHLNATVKFDKNYWYKARFIPKFNIGVVYKGDYEPERKYLRFFIDWHPAKKPYKIFIS